MQQISGNELSEYIAVARAEKPHGHARLEFNFPFRKIQDFRFSFLRFVDVNLQGGIVKNLQFDDCLFYSPCFVGVWFIGCTFNRCTIDHANFSGTKGICTFNICTMKSPDFTSADIENFNFVWCETTYRRPYVSVPATQKEA